MGSGSRNLTMMYMNFVPCTVIRELVKISVMPDINDMKNYRIYLLLQMYLLAIVVISWHGWTVRELCVWSPVLNIARNRDEYFVRFPISFYKKKINYQSMIFFMRDRQLFTFNFDNKGHFTVKPKNE